MKKNNGDITRAEHCFPLQYLNSLSKPRHWGPGHWKLGIGRCFPIVLTQAWSWQLCRHWAFPCEILLGAVVRALRRPKPSDPNVPGEGFGATGPNVGPPPDPRRGPGMGIQGECPLTPNLHSRNVPKVPLFPLGCSPPLFFGRLFWVLPPESPPPRVGSQLYSGWVGVGPTQTRPGPRCRGGDGWVAGGGRLSPQPPAAAGLACPPSCPVPSPVTCTVIGKMEGFSIPQSWPHSHPPRELVLRGFVSRPLVTNSGPSHPR